jgi:hypothetical protein
MGLAVVMVVLFVVFPAVLFNGIARIKGARAKGGTGGDALKMSELSAMIDETVARETSALRRRIEVLEEIATSRNDDFKLLNAAPPQLSLPTSEDDEEEAVAPPARTPARA